MPRARWKPLGVIVMAITLAGAGTASASAAKPRLIGDSTPRSTSVTLITGDRAVVTRTPDGRTSAALVSGEPYATRQVGEDLYVTPESAVPLLRDGRLDEQLFNVTGLVAQGYDDAHRKDLPLIVTAASGASRAAGVTTNRTLTSIGAEAVSADKTKLAGFFAGLSRNRSAGGKVWLDAKVKGFGLDPATGVEQTGAPQAWAGGTDGSGTKVAVLDTGYDPDHPDLKGQIAGAQDFTGSGSAADGFGHGTHVSSTIAGTGAASGGRRKGMAPGTRLLEGRVLNRSGYGQDSWIIAGMEWAVAQGADVASMSLGSRQRTDCTDPMAQAAERLSAQAKTLFVIAAGNNGVRQSVSSPGCADGVLTVGAVDSAGATASFSSRGPVLGSHHVKPDIAAPGVGIVGAALGSPGDNAYVAMSGTSMATPHVAGAAAILRQRHPDWPAQQLKAALMSGVKPRTTDGVYAQGAGELWVPGALDPSVIGPGSVNVAAFDWPHTTAQQATKSVTYTNLTDHALTLKVSLDGVTGQDGKPAPHRMLTLGATQVTVPAHGTANVPVTVDGSVKVQDSAYGEFGGRIVATADGVHVTSPVGFWIEPKTVNLTVKTVDRRGEAATSGGIPSFLDVVGLDESSGVRRYLAGKDETYRLRAGTYAISAFIVSRDPGTTGAQGLAHSLTYLGDPELRLDSDTTLTYDARKAVPIKVSGDRPLETHGALLQYGRWWDGSDGRTWTVSGGLSTNSQVKEFYTAATRPAHKGGFELGEYFRMYAPQLTMRVDGGPALHPEYVSRGLFDRSAMLSGSDGADLVDAKAGSKDDLARATGKAALVHVSDPATMSTVLTDAKANEVKVVLFTRDDVPGRWTASISRGITTPGLIITRDEAARLTGTPHLSWTGTPDSPYVYNLAFTDQKQVGPDQTHQVSDQKLASVTEHWYAQRQAGVFGDFMFAYRPWNKAGFLVGDRQPVGVPLTRTAYYTAGDTAWQQDGNSALPFGEFVIDIPRTYSSGQKLSTTWYKHPMQTGVWLDDKGNQTHVAERQGNLVGFSLPQWQDAEPAHYGVAGGFGDVGNLRLTRDGTEMGRSPYPFGQWVVPGDAHDYALTVSTERFVAGMVYAPDWRMSVRTDTTFRFRSSRPDGETVAALPFLLPDYDVNVDDHNLAPASRDFPVTLSFTGQPGYDPGKVGDVKAWASYDDGATWTEAPVSAAGGHWVAKVDNTKAPGGYVTLKVDATDSHGNGVQQTVIKAYGVR